VLNTAGRDEGTHTIFRKRAFAASVFFVKPAHSPSLVWAVVIMLTEWRLNLTERDVSGNTEGFNLLGRVK